MASKTDLFLELAQPSNSGISRWVSVDEFIDSYSELKFGNGASWARKESKLAKNYVVEFDKTITPGNGIDRLRLNGIQLISVSQYINSSIRKVISTKRCIITGISKIEIDHKNGRKMGAGGDPRALNSTTQKLSDFQPLSKAANDAKRQHCKECSKTNIRFDAKRLGYPVSYYKGVAHHNSSINGCEGCFWFDPVQFRKELTRV